MDKRKKWLIGGFIVVGSVTALLWFKGRTGANEPIRVLEKILRGRGILKFIWKSVQRMAVFR